MAFSSRNSLLSAFHGSDCDCSIWHDSVWWDRNSQLSQHVIQRMSSPAGSNFNCFRRHNVVWRTLYLACNSSLRVFGSRRAQIAIAADDTTTQMLFKAPSVRTRSPCVFFYLCVLLILMLYNFLKFFLLLWSSDFFRPRSDIMRVWYEGFYYIVSKSSLE